MGNDQDNEFGRRTYDVEIAKLHFEIGSLKKEVEEMRTDIKDLIEAWNSAKGMTSFVKWIASIAIAIGVIAAALKGVSK